MRAGLRMGNSWFKYRDVLQDSSKGSTLGQFPFGVSYTAPSGIVIGWVPSHSRIACRS